MEFIKRYLLPRIVQYLVVLFIGFTVIFIIPRLMPADPIEQNLQMIMSQGQYLDPDAIGQLRQTLKELYGLEGTMLQQYGQFWRRLSRGDFGPSFSQFPTPVMQLIGNSLPWSLGLMIFAVFIAWIIGSIMGALGATFSNSRWTKIFELVAMSIRPIPYYIMALFIVILFAYVLPLFPLSGGYEVGSSPSFSLEFFSELVKHAFLPALSIILLGVGNWFIQMRSVASNIVGEDFVTYAHASGIPKRKIILQYTLRNAILPQITGLALSLGMIFSGSLITEIVFAYPGIGSLLFRAILDGDYNLIMGITVISIFAIATTVLVIDFIYPLFDPRVRLR